MCRRWGLGARVPDGLPVAFSRANHAPTPRSPARIGPARAAISPPSGRTAVKSPNKGQKAKQRGNLMAFEIVAERESESGRRKRDSALMSIAKARVWASEGWNVTTAAGAADPPKLFRKSE